jgi:hypothetical protein
MHAFSIKIFLIFLTHFFGLFIHIMEPLKIQKFYLKIILKIKEYWNEQKALQTEVSKLIALIIHSLYSHKEIFLRSLINASEPLTSSNFLNLTTKKIKSLSNLIQE